MDPFVQHVVVLGGILAASLIGPVLAIGFLKIRKRRARARRRSPIGIDMLRGPGHTLREQLDEIRMDLLANVSILMVLPLLFLAMFLAHSHVRGAQAMVHLAPFYIAAALVTLLVFIRQLWTMGVRLDQLQAGYDAELSVGQELDQLMRQGAATFHDIPADNFNIDHVVIAVEGVFAVETKGFTKPKHGRGKADATVAFDGALLKFPGWTTKEPLEQAQRQSAWLAKWLTSAIGSPVHVLPVLALPG